MVTRRWFSSSGQKSPSGLHTSDFDSIDEPTMKSDVLRSTASFLAAVWSGCSQISVHMSNNLSRADGTRITVPDQMEVSVATNLEMYRCWRYVVWHAAQHLRMLHNLTSDGTPKDIHRPIDGRLQPSDLIESVLLDILEDLYVDESGATFWRGMVAEKQLISDVLRRIKRRHQSTAPTQGGPFEVLSMVRDYVLLGEDESNSVSNVSEKTAIRAASISARNQVYELVRAQPTDIQARQIILQIARELKRLLGDDVHALPDRSGGMTENSWTNSQIYNAISGKALRSSGCPLMESYCQLDADRTRSVAVVEARDDVTAAHIQIPEIADVSKLSVSDLTRVAIEDGLVVQMKARLRKWRSKFKEFHDTIGEEVDVEAAIDGHAKVFFNEAKLRAPNRIALLLDHSGSVRAFEKEYKVAVVALCEGLNAMGMEFAVFAFNQSHGIEKNSIQDNIWLVKGCKEVWEYDSIARLARISAESFTTPLGKILAECYQTVRAFKPEILILLTDGASSDPDNAMKSIKKYRDAGIKMLGIGIHYNAIEVAKELKTLGFTECLAVTNIRELPSKLIRVLTS